MEARGRRSLAALLLVATSTARAESTAGSADKPPSSVEHRVDFHAEHVELEPDAGALRLSGHVVVTSHRFRLTGRSLTVSRSPRGVHVEGRGELALCECAKAPVTLGFGGADLAPPTDVLLANATLRVFGVPVFWSPYLWLRSPSRLGLLPPTFAYRGEEGVLLGSGVHVPLASRGGSTHALDMEAGAYLRGGVRLSSALASASGRTTVALDYFRGEAIDVFSAHSFGERGAVFAERIDVLRGERASVAPATFERLALPSDRARLGVGAADTDVFGLAIAADAPRAGALDERGVTGPVLVLGHGGALGRRASYGVGLATQSADTPRGASFVGRERGELSTSAVIAGARSETSLAERAEFATLDGGSAVDVRSELRSRLGVPLARDYGELTHALEPYVEAALRTGSRSDSGAEARLSDLDAPPRAGLALAGVDTALAESAGRSAAELRVAAGVTTSPERARAIAATRIGLDVNVVRVAAEVRAVPATRSGELALRADLRAPRGALVAIHVDGANGDARAAYGIWQEDFARPAGTRFSHTGWTLGGRVRVPMGPFFGEAGSDVDISEKRWLASVAAIGYRHSCRCLSLLAAGSRRIGRRGFDLGIGVELAPR